MEFTQIRYFYLAAKYEHLTKAAKELHISQPALTKSIKQLEDELQTELFRRVGRNIVLTDTGKVLYKYAVEILSIERDLFSEIETVKSNEQEQVSLIVRCIFSMIPGIIKGFVKQHPEVSINVIQGNGYNLIKNNNYDLMISGTVDEMNKKECQILFTEPIDIGVSVNHPLASKEYVSIEEMKDTPYIGLTDNRVLGKTINNYFIENGFTPVTTIACDDAQIIQNLVKAEIGFTMLSRYTFNLSNDPDIKILKLAPNKLERNVYISWRHRSYTPKVVIQLKEYIINYIKDYQF